MLERVSPASDRCCFVALFVFLEEFLNGLGLVVDSLGQFGDGGGLVGDGLLHFAQLFVRLGVFPLQTINGLLMLDDLLLQLGDGLLGQAPVRNQFLHVLPPPTAVDAGVPRLQLARL